MSVASPETYRKVYGDQEYYQRLQEILWKSILSGAEYAILMEETFNGKSLHKKHLEYQLLEPARSGRTCPGPEA